MSLFRGKTAISGVEPWDESPLFKGFAREELDWLRPHVQARQVEAGKLLLKEGDNAAHLFLVQTGKLSVSKSEKLSSRLHQLGQYGPGDVVGEVALLDGLPRGESVRSLDSASLILIPFDKVHTLARSGEVVAQRVILHLTANLATIAARKLRKGSERALAASHDREKVGEIIVNTLILLCGYFMLLSALPRLPQNTALMSIPLVLVFGLGSWRFIRGSGYPLSHFGLGRRHLLGSLLESLIFTGPFLILATGIKLLVMQFDESYSGRPLLESPDILRLLEVPRVQALLLVYVLSSAVQELIVRGTLQSMLERFLVGTRGRNRAIVVCALLFSVSHLHTSLTFAALAFVPGLFWGWLFSRRRNLLGVTLSHIVVGAYIFFVMGVRL